MKWCCEVLESLYSAGGERGFSVVFDRTATGEPWVFIQCRAVDKERLNDIEWNADFPLSPVSERTIHYCPYCGKALAKWYRKYLDEILNPELLLRHGAD